MFGAVFFYKTFFLKPTEIKNICDLNAYNFRLSNDCDVAVVENYNFAWSCKFHTLVAVMYVSLMSSNSDIPLQQGELIRYQV